MIRTVSSIMGYEYVSVNILDGARKAQDLFYRENIEYFLAYDEEKLAGVVTKKELVNAHPNRIIADVMSNKFKYISTDMPVWQAKEIIDRECIDLLIVEDRGKVQGIVDNIILNIELSKHIDLLTGLCKSDYIIYNGYNFIRNQKPLSIIFIDIDNFGAIDKSYGHYVGDLILKDVAKILKKNIMEDAYLCRYAGDEFAIITPFNIEENRSLGKKLIEAIRKHKFPYDISVSASAGVCISEVQCNKEENIPIIIQHAINKASLASTKAKTKDDVSVVVEVMDMDTIA